MRNSWYPRQHAEYLSTLSDIDPKNVVAARDFTFGMQDVIGEKKSKFAGDSDIPDLILPSSKRKTKSLDVCVVNLTLNANTNTFSLNWRPNFSPSFSQPISSSSAHLLKRNLQRKQMNLLIYLPRRNHIQQPKQTVLLRTKLLSWRPSYNRFLVRFRHLIVRPPSKIH